MKRIAQELAAAQDGNIPFALIVVLTRKEMEANKRLFDIVRKYRSGEVPLQHVEKAFLDCMVESLAAVVWPGTREEHRELWRRALAHFGGVAKLLGGNDHE